MENVAEVAEVLEQKNEVRRSRRAAIMLGGAAVAGMAMSRALQAQSASMDAAILNFALNLEFLEAQFYTLATAGVTLDKLSTPIAITSGDGKTAGGSVTLKPNFAAVPFTAGSQAQNYAMETATEEQNHVKFLQSALNANSANAAVAMPNIDLYNSFNALAQAAQISGGFDPFASPENFLIGAYIFEDVGVTAYLGAAPLIQSSAYLTAALGIHAVEAYHAGSVRTQIFQAGAPLTTISQAVSAKRASLDGSNSNPPDDIGVGTATAPVGGTASTIVDVNFTGSSAARVQARTTTQVLNIVYGNAGSAPTPGLFFPNGLNGSIK